MNERKDEPLAVWNAAMRRKAAAALRREQDTRRAQERAAASRNTPARRRAMRRQRRRQTAGRILTTFTNVGLCIIIAALLLFLGYVSGFRAAWTARDPMAPKTVAAAILEGGGET